jgi:hypothetical protein
MRGRLLAALTASLALVMSEAHGQDMPLPVYVAEDGLFNIGWLTDSSGLSFQDVTDTYTLGIQPQPAGPWFTYDIATSAILVTGAWPQAGEVDSVFNGDIQPQAVPGSFAFLSPDGHFAVYQTDADEANPECNTVAIADLQAQAGALIPDALACNISHFNAGFDVRWSDDSSAFAFASSTASTGEGPFVTGFAGDLTAVQVNDLMNITMNGTPLYGARTADLNADGSLALLDFFTQLVLWKTDADDSAVLLASDGENGILGPAFSPDDDAVWYIDSAGLQAYDLVSGSVSLITSDVRSSWVDAAYFSPDGRYVALLSGGRADGVSRELYVEPMAQWLG